MSRTVALGAVIGFAVTILVMALWERSALGPPVPSTPVDAGVMQALPLRVQFPIGRPLDIRPGPGPVAEIPLFVHPKVLRRPRQGAEPQDAGP